MIKNATAPNSTAQALKQQLSNPITSTGEDLRDSLVHTAEDRENYLEAAALTDRLIQFGLQEIKPGRTVFEICRLMDQEMERVVAEEPGKRGIAFPCAVSYNDIICHLSPAEYDEKVAVNAGDLVKIELGMHVNQCPAFACHSFVLGTNADGVTQGRDANLLMAAWTAARATARQLRPGCKFIDIQQKLAHVAEDFGVQYSQGLMTHLVGKNMLAGDEGIIYRPTAEQLKLQDPKAVILPNQVFLVDVVVSDAQYAVARPTSHFTTIYKRSASTQALRFKSSRAFLNELTRRFGAMAFNLRSFDPADAGRRRVAIKECLKAELIHSYDVIADYEETARTARFAFTIITAAEAEQPATILTHPPFKPDACKNDKTASTATQALLN